MKDEFFSLRPGLTGKAASLPRRKAMWGTCIALALVIGLAIFGGYSLDQIPLPSNTKRVWVLGRAIAKSAGPHEKGDYVLDLGSGECSLYVRHGKLKLDHLVLVKALVLKPGRKPVLWEEERFTLSGIRKFVLPSGTE